MANKTEIRAECNNLAKEIENMLEETVPITPRPAARHVKIAEGITWPYVKGEKPDWHQVAIEGKREGVLLSASKTGSTDLADYATTVTIRQKEEILEGIKRAQAIAKERAAKRQQQAKDILNEPDERAALRMLRAEYTLMQLEEIKID